MLSRPATRKAARHLQRNRDVPVIGRIKRECVLFDARTIAEEDIPEIA